MGGTCSGALQPGHTSTQASVLAEKFLQQEPTVNRHGISFCNTCADMFLMKISFILKKNAEISTSESKVRWESDPTHTTIMKKY